jgi:hypothetical protein
MTAEDDLVPRTYLNIIPGDQAYNNNLVKCVDIFNKFIDNIRIEAESQEFKKSIKDYQQQSNDNYKSLMSYSNELFDKHPRLLVLRIDFHYRKDVDNRYLTEIERNERYFKIKEDLAHLLRNTRSNKLFKHMLGYAWKLEYTPETGFHYHCFFFFNEKRVQWDVNKARKIGEYWVNITEGRGRYFSCNRKKKNYKFLGIGKIHRNDVKLREGLEMAIAYVTKTDECNARVIAMDENGRTFGRSYT